MPREIWYLSLPFHLLSFNLFFFLSHYFTFPYLFLFSFISCALSLLLLSYINKKSQCLFCRSSQKKKDLFSPGYEGSPTRSPNISSSSLIFRALVVLFAQCMRLHLFFPRSSISAEGAFTAQLCWGTPAPPPPPALLSSPKHQMQVVGKLLEGERICSTSPKNPDRNTWWMNQSFSLTSRADLTELQIKQQRFCAQ